MLRAFDAHVTADPTRCAVVSATGERVSREELLTAAVLLANRLYARGTVPGRSVALHTPGAGPLFHAADLAALLAGAVPVSLPEHATAAELDAILAVMRPACVLDAAADERIAAAADRAGAAYWPQTTWPADARYGGHDLTARTVSRLPEPSGACVVATSGSTGTPKLVLLGRRALAEGIGAWCSLWPAAARNPVSTIACLPVSHIAQRIMGHYLMCLYGTTIHTTTPGRFAETVAAVRPSVLLGVPHTLSALVDAAEREGAVRGALREVALVVNGAAALPPEVAARFQALGVPVAGAYGMTETSVPAWHHLPEDGSGVLGEPVPGVEARVDTGGELLLRSPYVARYVTAWPRTRPVVAPDGWVHTGDRATRLPGGGVRLEGRIAATLKTSRGRLIVPEPVEAYLAAQPGVAAACLIGHGQPSATAMVSIPEAATWAPERLTAAERALLNILRTARRTGRLPWTDIGAIRIVGDSWPALGLLTPTGKVRRSAIADHYTARLEPEESPA
ncbi:AMP-binding protein [Streptomyces sp. NPDC021100]|uniref:AMP-binding protein n=1 Tax=Streptomyces sp. NPDC021100 TaxID=3365114 RepID=UPI0037A10D5F